MNTIYNTLRTDKGYKVYEEYLYEITGEECEEALDLVIPKNIIFADTDTCGYTFLLNEDGTVYDDVTFYKFDDKYWLASHKALDSYLDNIDFDYTVTDISDEYKMLQIEGRYSGEIAQSFYEYDISTLNFRTLIEMTYKDEKGYLARFGFSGEFGYQFFLPSSIFATFVSDVCEGIAEYGDELDRYLRFEVGQPITDIYQQEEYSLYEIGYSWNLDFTKEEFRGRDSLLEHIRSATVKSVGFSTKEKLASGTPVLFDDQIVGKIFWTANEKDSSENYLGLMIVNQTYAHSGVTFVTEDGQILKTQSSPYRIPESWNKE
ncbi:aminomethyl transferase family protein [Streptococcus agalactiae]|uniref:aminomethyl transferase family protein n=1 Tax=Streptococcus agalactiae TaxID=1311 RepID=UPI003C759F5A